MKTLKRTYALPPETLMAFEASVEAGRRSAVVAHLMGDWLAEREREALRCRIVEGCREMGAEYLAMAREWEPLEEEVARAFGE